MKRVFLICISIFSLFILTGCGSKKVTCTLEENEDTVGYILKTVAVATLDEGNIKKYDLELIVTFEDEELATSSYDVLVASYDENMTFKQKGKIVTGKSTEVLSEIISKDEFIEGYEGEGYTCK